MNNLKIGMIQVLAVNKAIMSEQNRGVSVPVLKYLGRIKVPPGMLVNAIVEMPVIVFSQYSNLYWIFAK